jgi:hypothetical protein
MPAMRIVHYNGTASTAGDRVAIVRGPAQRINVRNIDGANPLEISFDGGRNFYTLPINSFPLDMSCMLHFFVVRGVGGTAKYCIVTNEG